MVRSALLPIDSKCHRSLASCGQILFFRLYESGAVERYGNRVAQLRVRTWSERPFSRDLSTARRKFILRSRAFAAMTDAKDLAISYDDKTSRTHGIRGRSQPLVSSGSETPSEMGRSASRCVMTSRLLEMGCGLGDVVETATAAVEINVDVLFRPKL